MAFNVHYDCNDGEKTGIATNFNDLRDEIYNSYTKIKLWGEIEGDIGYVDDNHYGLFHGMEELEELDLTGLNANNITNMIGMFNECYSLTYLDLSNFDTSNVTNMGYMFYCCENLAKINLSSFDTSNVTNMNGMFYGCSSLHKIMVGDNWTTTNVSSSDNMFDSCYELPNFDSFRTDKTKAYVGEGGYLSPLSYEFLIQEQINYNGSTCYAYPRIKIGNTMYYDEYGALNSHYPDVADTYNIGLVKPDGTSITVNDYGTISTSTKIWTGTQAAYDAITTKDANTIYLIKES